MFAGLNDEKLNNVSYRPRVVLNLNRWRVQCLLISMMKITMYENKARLGNIFKLCLVIVKADPIRSLNHNSFYEN